MSVLHQYNQLVTAAADERATMMGEYNSKSLEKSFSLLLIVLIRTCYARSDIK